MNREKPTHDSSSSKNYSTVAFYYFSISLLLIYLVPATLAWYRRVKKGFFEKEQQLNCFCDDCKAKNELVKKKKLRERNNEFLSVKLLVYVTLLGVFFFLTYLTYTANPVSEEVFDPYEILGVSPMSSKEDVNRAYRKLSLLYHPDKVRGSMSEEQAEKIFINLRKARDVLLDEEAAKNYEKYGNPDGYQGIQVGLALPEFLLKAENANLVMAVYCAFLLIFIPTAVGCYYFKTNDYFENEVLMPTMAMYHARLNGFMPIKKLIEVYAMALEYKDIPMRESDNKIIPKIQKDLGVVLTSDLKHIPMIIKVVTLLHAHFSRYELPKESKGDLHFILNHSPKLVDAMVGICVGKCMSARGQEGQLFGLVLNILTFNQMLIQGMWDTDKEFLQMPFPDSKGYKKKLKTIHSIADIDSKKAAEEFNDLKPEQVEYVHAVARNYPRIVQDTVAMVVDEDTITPNSIAMLYVLIKDEAVTKKSKDYPVHAPYYPLQRTSKWWLMIGNRLSGRMQSPPVTVELRHDYEHNDMIGPEPSTIMWIRGIKVMHPADSNQKSGNLTPYQRSIFNEAATSMFHEKPSDGKDEMTLEQIVEKMKEIAGEEDSLKQMENINKDALKAYLNNFMIERELEKMFHEVDTEVKMRTVFKPKSESVIATFRDEKHALRALKRFTGAKFQGEEIYLDFVSVLPFEAPSMKGEHDFKLYVKCDSFVGIDYEITFKILVEEEVKKKPVKYFEDDDAEEGIEDGEASSESDSDSDIEEDAIADEKATKKQPKAQKKIEEEGEDESGEEGEDAEEAEEKE